MLRMKLEIAVSMPLEVYERLHEKPPRPGALDTFHLEPFNGMISL
jgi:hypothetical protein